MWITEKSRRMTLMTRFIALIILALLARLGWMQVLQGPQYKKIAEENRIRQITVQAPRGTIYDRNGAVLVSNRPSFAISVIPYEFTRPQEEIPLLAAITGVPSKEIQRMLNEGQEYPYTPVRLKRDADAVMVTKVQEGKEKLPGVLVEAIPVRHYLYNQLAAHTLGYVGVISGEEYEKRRNQGYHPSDMAGKEGIEKEWEEVLRGRDGGLQIEVNALGEQVQLLGDKKAVAGKGLVLTLDANLQKTAEEALASQVAAARKLGEPATGGCAVILEANTGAVLALASVPAFNPNLFASGISTKEWQRLIQDPNFPLINKAIQNAYPPGSVFKIVTLAAALDTGLTNTDEIFEDKGVYRYGGWDFYGWETKGLGKLNVVEGLGWSSDPVFYELGRRLGIQKLADYAYTFGLGEKTGIGLQGETAGVVPTEEWKAKNIGEPWYGGETVIAAIGQGYYLSTALQQAMLLMAVANGGIMYRPMLVDKVITTEGALVEDLQPEVLRTVYLQPAIWDTLRSGLVAVTTRGTAAAAFRNFRPAVAGKTGSSETGTGTVHSWFACYAPAEHPQIVISVLVEHGGDGSVSAVPVTKKILETYFAK